MTHRTTAQLVRQAVQAAQSCGVLIGEIRIESGGKVTIVALDAVVNNTAPKGGATCDEVFG
jgi:hypothetical protein